jgi:hypothetical protein
MMEFSEQGLSDLLGFIRGTGRDRMLGSGINTYPNHNERNKTIHNACLVLEERGLITRIIDNPNHILWGALQKESDEENEDD